MFKRIGIHSAGHCHWRVLPRTRGEGRDPRRSWPCLPAEATVGRPLTPVSVAGVARRTARRN